jgi:hypothetical protein
MRLITSENRNQRVKIAQHIKIPYVSDFLDIMRTKYQAYGNIYNILYQASNSEMSTYFFIKNNQVYYYRVADNKIPIFKLDILKKEHRILDTSHLIHRFKDINSTIVMLESGKRYIITNNVDWNGLQECAAIIEAQSGYNLYIETRQSNLYLRAFLLVCNSIVPVLQVTEYHINIHMVDLITERLYTISWSLSDLKNIISAIVSESRRYLDKTKEWILNNDLKHIDRFSDKNINYIYESSKRGISYLKALEISFELSLSGMDVTYVFSNVHIIIKFDGNKILCYWNSELGSESADLSVNIQDPFIDVYDRKSILKLQYQEISRKIIQISTKEYPYKVEIHNNHLSNVLYSNMCGQLSSNSRGLGIITKTRRIMHYYNEAVLHHYNEYVIILANLFLDINRKMKRLIIIDTKSGLMNMWDISEYEWACSSESIMYECYYFDKYKQLIFISPSHESICMFCIDINELLNTFKSKQKAGCKVKKYKYIRDLVRSYNIRRLIIKSITNHHKKEPKEQSVQIIGYHVNRVDSEIYIVAKYILNEGRNITKDAVKIYKGLFIGGLLNLFQLSFLFRRRMAF